ncbi:hypothetical protein ACU686_26765 [Yinghuangia aomiensis]
MGGIGAADLMSSPGLFGYAGLAAGAGVMLLGYRQVAGRRAALSASGFADRRELADLRGDALVKRRGQLRHTLAGLPAEKVVPDWLGWCPATPCSTDSASTWRARTASSWWARRARGRPRCWATA